MKRYITFCFATAALVAGALLGAATAPAGRAVSATVPTASEVSDNSSAVLYIMRAWEGKIGIFRAGSDSAERVLDVYVETLPKEDQDKLAAGIPVYTEKQLEALIGNYTG